MGCAVCTEPQCLYKGVLYLLLYINKNTIEIVGCELSFVASHEVENVVFMFMFI